MKGGPLEQASVFISKAVTHKLEDKKPVKYPAGAHTIDAKDRVVLVNTGSKGRQARGGAHGDWAPADPNARITEPYQPSLDPQLFESSRARSHSRRDDTILYVLAQRRNTALAPKQYENSQLSCALKEKIE